MLFRILLIVVVGVLVLSACDGKRPNQSKETNSPVAEIKVENIETENILTEEILFEEIKTEEIITESITTYEDVTTTWD